MKGALGGFQYAEIALGNGRKLCNLYNVDAVVCSNLRIMYNENACPVPMQPVMKIMAMQVLLPFRDALPRRKTSVLPQVSIPPGKTRTETGRPYDFAASHPDIVPKAP